MPRSPPMLAGVLLLALLAAALAAPLAQAHAVPVRATPSGGSIVQALPRDAELVFSERVEPAFTSLEVRNASGAVVSETWRLEPDGLTLRAALPRDVDYGSYTLVWRALSAVDGHSTRGVVTFLFPDPSKPINPSDLPSTETGPAYQLNPLDPVLRALVLIGLFAALGTAVLVFGILAPEAPLAPPEVERRLGRFAAAGALVAALATLVLAASQAGAAAQVSPLAALAQPRALVAGTFGQMAAVRVPLLMLAAGLAWVGSRRGGAAGRLMWVGAAGACLVAVATLSLSSHSAALRQPALPVLNDALHALAAAAWMGGLAGVGYVLFKEGPGFPHAGVAARFSALATVAVAVVVITGTAASVVHLRSLDGLLGTLYGQVLLAKIALVAPVLALGARNKLVLVPALARAAGEEAAAAAARFGRSVRVEAGLGVGVLVVAGLLTALSPPAPEAQGAPPAVLELEGSAEGVDVVMLLTPSPVQVGPSTFDLFLTVAGASDGNATNATLTLRPPDRTLGESLVFLKKAHVGHFAGEGTYFSMPGTWTMRVQVQRTGAFDVVLDFEVPVETAPGG